MELKPKLKLSEICQETLQTRRYATENCCTSVTWAVSFQSKMSLRARETVLKDISVCLEVLGSFVFYRSSLAANLGGDYSNLHVANMFSLSLSLFFLEARSSLKELGFSVFPITKVLELPLESVGLYLMLPAAFSGARIITSCLHLQCATSCYHWNPSFLSCQFSVEVFKLCWDLLLVAGIGAITGGVCTDWLQSRRCPLLRLRRGTDGCSTLTL